MVKLSIEALRMPKISGVKYKKVKTFRNEKKAQEFAEELQHQMRSRRHQPMIQQVKVGWHMGYVYRVCIPKGVKI